MTAQASRQPSERDRDVARQAALRSLVTNLVGLAVMVGFSVAIAKRDHAARLAMRVRHVVRQEWRHAAADLAVAELQRAVSEWEHRHDTTSGPRAQDRGAARPGRGLYGDVPSSGAAPDGDAAVGGGGHQ